MHSDNQHNETQHKDTRHNNKNATLGLMTYSKMSLNAHAECLSRV
jgi:hypothetical protein